MYFFWIYANNIYRAYKNAAMLYMAASHNP